MANIYTSVKDEEIITKICRHGLMNTTIIKWRALRIALAKSLAMSELPEVRYDNIDTHRTEYRLQQVTGDGHAPDSDGVRDFNDAICAILSVLHEQDLFAKDKEYHRLLQRHIRRGLDEIDKSWSRKDDFYDYLYQEFFSANIQEQSEHKLNTDSQQENDKKLLKQLHNATGLQAELIEVKRGYRLQRYVLRFAKAGDFNTLKKELNKLCFQLGLGEGKLSVGQAPEPLTAWLDYPLPKEQWKSVCGKDLRAWLANVDVALSSMSMWIGVDILGNPYVFDLNAAPHVFVAGTTGSGKSVCVHAMLLSLLWRLSADEVQLCLIDPKRVDYIHYAGIPHLYEGSVITEVNTALSTLNMLIKEMEYRTRTFAKYGHLKFEDALANSENVLQNLKVDHTHDTSNENTNASDYQRKFHKRLFAYLVICIDELADLIMQEPNIEPLLVRLAQKGRAMGIRLILATQRPDAKTFTGNLRSNIPGRIALAVQKASESKIILDKLGAEGLLKPGDMLVCPTAGTDMIRVHGVDISVKDIAKCVQSIKGNND
ncbi:MAG: FtsK/SpoIIIE domain-containing protein [Mariprofundales bacterium]